MPSKKRLKGIFSSLFTFELTYHYLTIRIPKIKSLFEKFFFFLYNYICIFGGDLENKMDGNRITINCVMHGRMRHAKSDIRI